MYMSISCVGSLHVTGGELGDVLHPREAMSSQVDVVDLSSGETSRGPPMRNRRDCHAAVASLTSLYVFGGLYAETKNLCELFNAQTKQ